MLDIFGYDCEPNGADTLSTVMNLGLGLFDDATEHLSPAQKEDEFGWLEKIMRGERPPNNHDDLFLARATSAYLLERVVHSIKPEYVEQFTAAASKCNRETQADDAKKEPNLDVRVQLGYSYGTMNYFLAQSRIHTDVSAMRPIFEYLFAGGSIIDDMSDVCDDMGMKVTKPVSMLEGREPTLYNILRAGIIPQAFHDADQEFQKGVEACPTHQSRQKLLDTVALIKATYTVKLIEKSLKKDYLS